MLLWVGSQANPEFVQDVFGVPAATQIDTQVCELPALDTPPSAAVRALVADVRSRRRAAMRVSRDLANLKRGTSSSLAFGQRKTLSL